MIKYISFFGKFVAFGSVTGTKNPDPTITLQKEFINVSDIDEMIAELETIKRKANLLKELTNKSR